MRPHDMYWGTWGCSLSEQGIDPLILYLPVDCDILSDGVNAINETVDGISSSINMNY